MTAQSVLPDGPSHPFAACAMYVFDDEIRRAWDTLLRILPAHLADPRLAGGELEVVFADNANSFRSPNMVIGHTCGLPLLERWQSTYLPVSVPLFDIPGCNGTRYRSWLVCQANDSRDSLREFRDTRVAINGRDSNSGMNVLRHEIVSLLDGAHVDPSERYFKRVIISGSHEASLRAVANGEADLAAIDVVSYFHLTRLEPALSRQTRIFSSTVETTGLPFVVPRKPNSGDPDLTAVRYTEALNKCYKELPEPMKQVLRLRGFCKVGIEDFQSIRELTKRAGALGFGVMR